MVIYCAENNVSIGVELHYNCCEEIRRELDEGDEIACAGAAQ
jgi:hypothetical protein